MGIINIVGFGNNCFLDERSFEDKLLLMMIFTANPTSNTEMLPIFKKEGWLWETAFCPKDQVAATYQEEKLLLVDNGGPRRCGYKGE